MDGLMTDETRQAIFEEMATLYPHEMAAAYPEEFRQFFKRQCPGVSEEDMQRLLKGK
jgi:hypothetical protein